MVVRNRSQIGLRSLTELSQNSHNLITGLRADQFICVSFLSNSSNYCWTMTPTTAPRIVIGTTSIPALPMSGNASKADVKGKRIMAVASGLTAAPEETRVKSTPTPTPRKVAGKIGSPRIPPPSETAYPSALIATIAITTPIASAKAFRGS